jgi:hypothetical protein
MEEAFIAIVAKGREAAQKPQTFAA